MDAASPRLNAALRAAMLAQITRHIDTRHYA